MRKLLTILVLFCALIFALLVWFIIIPAFKVSSSLKRFQLGMSYEQAVLNLTPPFQIFTGTVYSGEGPSAREIQHREILARKNGVLLAFNEHGKLDLIVPLGSPWHSIFVGSISASR